MRKLLGLSAIVLAAACQDGNKVAPVSPDTPANASLAYVTLSNLHPSIGETIVVTVRTGTGSGAEPLGSFAARLMPGAGLEYLSESEVSGGARAMRVSGDTVYAAGAAPSGFTDGRLFAIKARVTDPLLLSHLELVVTEATNIQFVNQTGRIKVEGGLFRENR